jgi:GNAT superfamily N-acetyltransferase
VSRPVVTTRLADVDDLDTMQALWDELRQVGGRAERAMNPSTLVEVREPLQRVLADPLCRIVLASVDGGDVGMTVMKVAQPDPLSDAMVVNVVHLVVSRTSRHRGIGPALLAAAADFAAERHIDHVAVSVYPSLRDASRFYARLGFAPVAVRRIASVAGLRRQLSREAALPGAGELARRRSRLIRPIPPQRARRNPVEKV